MASELEADVIVIDLYMPGMDGLEATRRILDANPRARVLAITAGDELVAKDAAFAAGAVGFVRKPAPIDEILRAIRLVADGEVFVEARDPVGADAPPRAAERNPKSRLSEREEQVLRHFAEGLVMKDIAAQTNLSTRTLETYKARGMEKLGIGSRADLVQYALKQGWLKPDFNL